MKIKESPNAHGESALHAPDNSTVNLLVPIKTASDAICGARYAANLARNGKGVKIVLLHVTKPRREEASPHTFSASISRIEERRAEILLNDAASYLGGLNVSHRTYIVSGHVVFSILDAAELLNCDEIILAAAKRRTWLRPFSSNTVMKIAHASRSVPVVMVDSEGIASSSHKEQEALHKQDVAYTGKSA